MDKQPPLGDWRPGLAPFEPVREGDLLYGRGTADDGYALFAAVTGLLVYEHGLVKPTDLSRVDAAFFTMNGWVSVLFFVFWAADIFLIRQPL